MTEHREIRTQSTSEGCDKVFAYGSLRKHQKYHYLIQSLISDSRPATIRGRIYHFALPGSRGDFPYLTREEGVVHGDVLTFCDLEQALAVLDDLEDHPNLYRREAVEVEYADGTRDRAYAYCIVSERAPGGAWIPSGDWLKENAEPAGCQ